MSPRMPAVLVVYEHGSPAHAQRVRSLVERLRTDGVDVIVDQHVDDPLEGWSHWMRQQLLEHEVVLLVVTPAHRAQLESGHDADQPKLGDCYNLLLVFFEGRTELDVPWGRPQNRFRLPESYEQLYRRLAGWNAGLPLLLPSSEARPGGRSWGDQITAAQRAGDLEAQESTEPHWSRAPGDVGHDDHLWDTGSAAALDVIANRVPVTTRGSTIIAGGRVRHKQRPIPDCPDCDGPLDPLAISVRFELAADATAVQEVPGYRCAACGSEWPEPSAMRAAHANAFGSSAERK